jgi:hypothetical protein
VIIVIVAKAQNIKDTAMNQESLLENGDDRKRINALIKTSPPVLVEVRFPNAATSPDWYLCQEESELDEIIERLGPGSELHVSSVWDLTNRKGDLHLRR